MLKKIYENGGNCFIFFMIFNVIFLIFGLSLKYATPFVISLLLTVWLKPLSTFLQKKTKIKPVFINIGCILLSLALIIGICFLVGFGIFKETSSILNELSYLDMSAISDKINIAKEEISKVSPEILNNILNYIQGLAGNLTGLLSTIGNWILKVAGFVPSGIIGLIIVILSTYYMMRDYDIIAEKFDNLKIWNSEIPKKMLKRTNSIVINYIQSYSVLLTITFIECITVFYIFDVKYLFSLSVICVVLDILPIVGSAIVYIPVAIIFAIQGKIITALWILILYSVFVVVRNIMEPKLLSKSLEIHPLLILISVYVGASVYGIMGVIYCILLIAYFKLLKEMEII